MKKSHIIHGMAMMCALLFTACNDAEYSVKENSIYLADAVGSSKTASLSIEDNGVDINVVVRLAKPLEYDVQVEVTVDPQLLERYNTDNSTEYQILPLEHTNFTQHGKVTIPAKDVSATLKIHVDKFDTKNKRYALPLALSNVLEGDIEKSVSQSKFIYVLATPLTGAVPVMTGANNASVTVPNGTFGFHVSQWSLEAWTRMSGYNINNQAIFDIGSSDHGIYIRFGDANGPYNYLQVKTLGGQVQTERDLDANIWYHWAFVYDGTTFFIYRNGELNVKFDPPAPIGGDIRFDYIMMFNSGKRYFVDQCQMSQVRLWKKAISQTQIKNNMRYAIEPDNPDLIAYWPMNEGSGNTFTDITGHGYNAVAGNGILLRWEQDVRIGQ
jgi:hypothetical protein